MPAFVVRQKSRGYRNHLTIGCHRQSRRRCQCRRRHTKKRYEDRLTTTEIHIGQHQKRATVTHRANDGFDACGARDQIAFIRCESQPSFAQCFVEGATVLRRVHRAGRSGHRDGDARDFKANEVRAQKNRRPRRCKRCGYGRHYLYQSSQSLRRRPPQNAALKHAACISLEMTACNVQALLIAEIWEAEPEIGQCDMSPTAQ